MHFLQVRSLSLLLDHRVPILRQLLRGLTLPRQFLVSASGPARPSAIARTNVALAAPARARSVALVPAGTQHLGHKHSLNEQNPARVESPDGVLPCRQHNETYQGVQARWRTTSTK